MKTALPILIVILAASVTGCAFGPTGSVVINPFDWRSGDAGASAPPAALTNSIAHE